MADEQYEDMHGEEDLDVGLDGEGDPIGGDHVADAQAELAAMKAKLAEMEAEANKLKDLQAKVEKEAGLASGAAGVAAPDQAAKEEADARSVYVGNVDYGCTPEELQMHFQGCGTVNRVTILTDKAGNAKGFAYIEFLEADAVQQALLLDGSELRQRSIKVSPKRTNVPGLKAFRGGRGRGFGRGPYGGRGGFYGGRGYGGYGYGGGFARGRGRGRWIPY